MLLPGVDHLPHTLDLAGNAFSRGEPDHGIHLADQLERIVDLHDASTIAAVIVEPVAGSIGVYPPPKGYLKRLREICDRHGILLIFDEVITGFGRVGAAFASERFGVTPDMMTLAKGLTNGTVPASAVVMKKDIYDTFMTGPDWMVELTHGFTYSAHPLAVAAGLATLDLYRDEQLFERSASLSPVFEDAVHSLKGLPNVIDVRNIGMMGAVEFARAAASPAGAATMSSSTAGSRRLLPPGRRHARLLAALHHRGRRDRADIRNRGRRHPPDRLTALNRGTRRRRAARYRPR